MISSESLNKLLNAFANFVSRLTDTDVKFTSVGPGERIPIAAMKIENLIKEATDALDNQKVRIACGLESGKIYVLSVDACVMDSLDDVISGLKSLYGIELICIDKNTMEFVRIPEGYKIVKKKL